MIQQSKPIADNHTAKNRKAGVVKIGLPSNILLEDELYFKPYSEWEYFHPYIQDKKCTVVFKDGRVTNSLLKPIDIMSPWHNFYEDWSRKIFLGNFTAALKKLSVDLMISKKYYLCVNEFSDNYFHWFTEVLPKMVFIKKTIQNDVVFFVPHELQAYQIDSLRICGLEIRNNKKEANIFYNISLVPNCVYTGCFHPELLHATQKLISAHFKNDNTKNGKIYVTRKNAKRRRILNEDEVCEILVRKGFQILDFDIINFKEQVQICSHTSVFISVHGAALTNMIYMKAGSKVIEFLPTQNFNDKCYFALSGIMKHFYYYLFCETNGPSHILADYKVDLDKFETLLDKVLA